MAETTLDPPRSKDSSELADWVELMLLVERWQEVTIDELGDLISAAGEDSREEEDGGEDEHVDVEDAELERVNRRDARLDLLIAEIRRRRRIAPNVYAYRVEEEVVGRAGVAVPLIYHFLLWLSFPNAPFRGRAHTEAEEPFDRLAQAALEVFVGPRSQSVLFARRYAGSSPSSTKRPQSFPDAILWLRELLRLGPNHQEPPSATPPDWDEDLPARTYQDGGVDIVVWMHFRDERAGFPVLLAQTTIQRQWRPKTRDISLALWGDWIRFVSSPQKALVIPHAVPEGKSWWLERNRAAGFVVDRIRLCDLLDDLPRRRLRDLLSPAIRAWLRKEIANVRA